MSSESLNDLKLAFVALDGYLEALYDIVPAEYIERLHGYYLRNIDQAIAIIRRHYEGRPAVPGKPLELQTRDELLAYIRQHELEQNLPKEPITDDNWGKLAGIAREGVESAKIALASVGSSCGRAQHDKAEEIQPSGYSVEKDSRSDCPWKCKSGDLKCLCANQREMLDNTDVQALLIAYDHAKTHGLPLSAIQPNIDIVRELLANTTEPVMSKDELRKIVLALRNSQDAIENDIDYLAHAAGVAYVD